MSKKGQIQYYQIREKGKQINFIWTDGKHTHVAEVRRIPFEEGFTEFMRAQKDAKVVSSELDIHEFAAHLETAFKKKS